MRITVIFPPRNRRIINQLLAERLALCLTHLRGVCVYLKALTLILTMHTIHIFGVIS